MLTLAQLRDDALSYVGIDDLNQAPASLRQRIVNDINAALQEIYTEGPSFLREKSFTAVLPLPRELTGKMFVTGSTSVSGGSAVSDDMVGCTFRITGEESDNEIVDASALQNPFQGATTNEGFGVVYSDCVVFPENVVSIAGPVWLNGKHKLEPLSNRTDWQSRVTGRKEIGTPRFYWIEPYHTQLRLRVYPMPSVAYVLRYDAQIKAPQATFLDVWNVLPTADANTNNVLRVDHSDGGIDGSLRVVQDNAGNASALYLSAGAAKVHGDFEATGALKRNGVDVVDGSDGRLSDARTPTAHAVSHTNGTDDIQSATASQKGLATTAQIAKLDGIEAGADVTDATNVAAAGAVMAEADPVFSASEAASFASGDKSKLDGLLTAAQLQLLLNAKYPSGGVYVASHPSGKLTITDVAGLDLNEKSFTLGLCFAADDWSEATTLMDCVSGSNGFKLEKLAAGTLKLTVGDGTGTMTATSSAALPATDGRPSVLHVVVTRGATDATVDFYCDGAAVGTQQTLTGLALAENVTVPADLTIKCDGALYGGVFRGIQPVLRNYAMSAAEVSKDVTTGLMFSDIGAGIIYQSDFSAGVDNWNVNRGTSSGNNDAVSDGSVSKDDCLKFYANAVNNTHSLYSYREIIGKRVRVTFEYFIPNSGGSGYLNGLLLRTGGNYGLYTLATYEAVGAWTSASLDVSLRTGVALDIWARKNGLTTFIGANDPNSDLFYIRNFKIEVLGYLALIDAEAIGYQKQDLSGKGNHALLGDSTPQIGGSILLLTEAFLRSVVNHTADGYLLANQNIIPANYYIESIVVKNDTANAVTINMGTSVGGSQIVSGAVIGANATVYCTVADRFAAAAAAQKVHINSSSWNSASLKTAIVLRKIAA
ncbi:MAG: hypothetical protein V1746_08030 [bacterium]